MAHWKKAANAFKNADQPQSIVKPGSQEILKHYEEHLQQNVAGTNERGGKRGAQEEDHRGGTVKKQKPSGRAFTTHCPKCFANVGSLSGAAKAAHRAVCGADREWVTYPTDNGLVRRSIYLEQREQGAVEKSRDAPTTPHRPRCFEEFGSASEQERDSHTRECASVFQPWVYLTLGEGQRRRAGVLAREGLGHPDTGRPFDIISKPPPP
ncbi:MAG: hypothetical protein M1813_000542 [Trichoglossum hirsutum]|nr:MAG: hypothetical protein M1813_000542 [Trichoglossum hirsutum]